jgi:pseudouridine-5'-phosphate glycosidase
MSSFDVRPEVRAAVAERRPIVALESTLFAHGLPSPDGVNTARVLEQIVREHGATPATIGVIDGRVIVGLTADEIARLATEKGVRKLSRADLAHAVSARSCGATTVSATMFAAHRAGIEIFATGGIGGVHRGVEQTMDVSADLTELSRTRVCVVAAGAKSILDLPRTLEMLETLGVPVVGFGTDELPAFFVRSSGLKLTQRVEDASSAARMLAAQRELAIDTGVLLAVPPPIEHALDPAMVHAAIEEALVAAEREGVRGKAVTPRLLTEVRARTGGASLAANVALVRNNAAVAADVAVALAALT